MALTNFEQITEDLTSFENKLMEFMMKGFATKTKADPIKANEIIIKTNAWLIKEHPNVTQKLTEPRLRKITNHIRAFGLQPLIATSNGYYISFDKEEIEKQISSLNERARSMNQAATGLKEFLK